MKTLIPHLILEQYAQGQLHGNFPAAAACVDISGFTRLTEMLFLHRQDGAEILGETLGLIFGPLISAVYQAGGLIPLYAGDAFTAIFPRNSQAPKESLFRAWQTATHIQTFLMPDGSPKEFSTPYGNIPISVKIGLAEGEVEWGIIGQARPRSFYFRGSAIAASNLAQGTAAPGQIVIESGLDLDTNAAVTAPDFPKTPQILDEKLVSHLSDFIPSDILTLPVRAEFRNVCPVFIAVQLPVEKAAFEAFTLQVLQQTQHFGGYLSQIEFMTDQAVILLYFGAPISYENNVIRAARFLNKMVESQRPNEAKPIWRAGLTYGLVWAGFRGAAERQEYGIMGDVVNTAARISQQAPWGQIWLDEQAAVRLADEFDCQLLGNRLLKGKQLLKTIYRLGGHLTKINLTHHGRMIGRTEELKQLKTMTSPILEGQFAGAAFVYGAAGMGKSRLLLELQQQLNDRVQWLYCPADEVLRQSFNPFRFFIQNYFQEGSYVLDKAQFLKKLEFLIERVAALPPANPDIDAAKISNELMRTRSCLAALLNIRWPKSLYERLEPRFRYDNTQTALTVFLQALALCQPIVLQFEDFHWFDQDSRSLLPILGEKLDRFPAAIIFTSRFGEDGSLPTVTWHQSTETTVIKLDSLDRTELRALAEQILGGSIHSELLDFLVVKSGGRPFFAEQLVFELRDQSAVILDSGQYRLREEKTNTIPTTLNTLLVSRLDRLPLPVKQVVQTAAVLGERFQIPVLKGILAENGDISSHLQIAAQQRIWVLEDDRRGTFNHALLRDAAYTMQLQSYRRNLHYQAAAIMEEIHADQPGPHYGEIAYHFEKAYLLGLTDMREQASRYLSLAAEKAIDKYDNEAVLDYVTRALAITPESAYHQQFELLIMRESVSSKLARHEIWRTDIEALVSLAGWTLTKPPKLNKFGPSQLTTEQQAKTACQISWFLFHTGHEKLAKRYVRQGLKMYHQVDNHYGEARCLAVLGGILWAAGEFDEVEIIMGRALEIFYDLEKYQDVIGCLNTLGISAADQGQYIQAWDYYKEAMKLVNEDSAGPAIMTLNNLGEVTCWLGLYDQSQKYTEQGLRIAGQSGYRMSQTLLLINLSLVEIDRGNGRLAQLYLNRSLEMCREVGNRREEGTVLHNLGCTAELAGDLEMAEAYFEQALAIRTSLDQQQFAAEDRAALAQIAHQLEDIDKAKEMMTKVADYLKINPAVQGAYKPIKLYRRLYQVARQLNPEQASSFLQKALEIIRIRANKIADPEIRQAYLQNVPENSYFMNERPIPGELND